MTPRKTSIATFVIVILVTVATLLLGGWGVFNYLSESQEKNAMLATETDSLASQLAAGLALPLWNFDRPQVDKIIESVMQTPEVYGVIVRQNDVSAPGRIAIHARMRGANGTVMAIDHEIAGDGLLVKELPIIASGETIGSVRLYVTPKYVEASLRKNLISLAAKIFTLDVLLVLSLFMVLRWTVLRPLKAVEQYASAVSSGGSHQTGEKAERFYGEIESVRSSIEKMVGMLDERYAALRLNEEQYRQLFDQTIVGISIFEVICDNAGLPVDFRLIRANPAFDALTGLKREEQIGKVEKELSWKWPPELKQRLMELAYSGGQIQYDRFNASVGRHYEVRAFSPKWGQFALIFNDVTEQKRAEAIMLESEKMRTVAGLAAGMAHEINNPLAGMVQNAEVLLNRLSSDLPANQLAAERSGITLEALSAYMTERDIPEMLGAIRASGQRAAKIVANMLSFSRKNESQINLHVITELLDQTVELAGSDFDLKKSYDFKNIQVVRDYAAAMPGVPCRASEIQQVILNLLKNSAQAMLERGERGDIPRIVIRTARDNGDARIEVEDNGPGMPEAVRRSVFEPFFTTKGPQAGTGLGLFVSYFIITRNHGGTIAVESVPGTGTKFIIKLPLRQEAAT